MPDKYFIWDSNGCGFETFETVEKRDEATKEAIEGYIEGVWEEEVEDIVCGVITHRPAKCNVQKRPPENEIDENGEDEEGYFWGGDLTERYDYEMKEV